MHGVENSAYTEFVHLISKVEVLINSRPLGGYQGVWGDMVLRPCDLLFPMNANVLVKLSQELPRGANREVGHINQALAVFDTFKEQWSSMYLHDLRRLNVKKFDRHELKENDFVVLLDRAQQNHEFCYGLVTKKVTKHHLKVRVISRGMKLDKNYQMTKPAVTLELDRAPESLVFLFRMDQTFDPFDTPIDISDKGPRVTKRKPKEKWSLSQST